MLISIYIVSSSSNLLCLTATLHCMFCLPIHLLVGIWGVFMFSQSCKGKEYDFSCKCVKIFPVLRVVLQGHCVCTLSAFMEAAMFPHPFTSLHAQIQGPKRYISSIFFFPSNFTSLGFSSRGNLLIKIQLK